MGMSFSVPLRKPEPTMKDRLQALTDFLQWISGTYDNPDTSFHVCLGLLHALQIGEKTRWGSRQIVGFVNALTPDQLEQLRQDVQQGFDRLIPANPETEPAVPRVHRFLTNCRAGTTPKSSQSVFRWVYDTREAPTVATLRDVMLCCVADLLEDLYTTVIVRCETCGKYSVRGIGRDKTYCSVLCRVKASQQRRREAEFQQREEDRKLRSTERHRRRPEPHQSHQK